MDDDLCVHCGDPIEHSRYRRRDDATGWRGPGWQHRIGQRGCPDGSGHLACPAQGGFE